MTVDIVAEQSSFDAFFRANYAPLTRALAVAAGPDAAAEAVQEAFVRGELEWDHVRDLSSPVSWVRRIAVNHLVDDGARRVSAAEALEFASGDVELAEALAAMPHKQRLAVSLFHVLELTVDEIAKLLDASPGTVKSNLADANRRLSRPLGGTHGP